MGQTSLTREGEMTCEALVPTNKMRHPKDMVVNMSTTHSTP